MQQEFLPTQMTLSKSKVQVQFQSNKQTSETKGQVFQDLNSNAGSFLSWRSTSDEEKGHEEMVHYALQLTL